MSEPTIEQLFLRMSDQILFVSKLIHFQAAEIAALRAHTIAEIAARRGVERTIVARELSKSVRVVYDQRIEQLERTHPALAASIDMRSELDSGEQDSWYFPKDNPPSKS